MWWCEALKPISPVAASTGTATWLQKSDPGGRTSDRLVRGCCRGMAGEAGLPLCWRMLFSKIWRRLAGRDAAEFDNYARQIAEFGNRYRKQREAAGGRGQPRRLRVRRGKTLSIAKYGDGIFWRAQTGADHYLQWLVNGELTEDMFGRCMRRGRGDGAPKSAKTRVRGGP